MVYIKSYIFNNFYEQYLALLTMAPRNNNIWSYLLWSPVIVIIRANCGVVNVGGERDFRPSLVLIIIMSVVRSDGDQKQV